MQCNYQVSDEVVHDVENYPDQGQCYLHKAEVDNMSLTEIWIIHYTAHYTAQYRPVLLAYNSQSVLYY